MEDRADANNKTRVGTEAGNGAVHQAVNHFSKSGIKENGRDLSIHNSKQFFKFCKAFVRVATLITIGR